MPGNKLGKGNKIAKQPPSLPYSLGPQKHKHSNFFKSVKQSD